MTKEQLAELLIGNDYRNEMTRKNGTSRQGYESRK